MYSLEEKDNVIKRLKQGESVADISKDTGISQTTIYKWRKELELRRKIKKMIEEGQIEEAKQEIKKLEGRNAEVIKLSFQIRIAREEGNSEERKRLLQERLKIDPNSIQAISILIRIAEEEGDREEEKRLLQEILRIDPNNVKAMSSLIRIARGEGNREEEKRLLQEILRVDPDDVKAMSSLIRIARAEGDREEEKRLSQEQLRINPNNVKAISSLIRIAREEGNREEEKRLSQEQLRINPENVIAMRSLTRIAREEGDIEEEKRLLQEQLRVNPDDKIVKRQIKNFKYLKRAKKIKEDKVEQIGEAEKEIEEMFKTAKEKDETELTPLDKAREIIYQSEDIVQDLETIKELLAGEEELDRQIALAELYYHTGLVERAEKSLKTYKRSLSRETQRGELREVNKAIELVKDSKTRTRNYKWNEFWQEKRARQEKAQVTAQYPTGHSEDDDGR